MTNKLSLIFILATIFYNTSFANNNFENESKSTIELEERGEVSFQTRSFVNDDKTETKDEAIGIFARTDLALKSDSFELLFRGYGLMDKKDPDRDHLSIEDFFFSWFPDEDQNYKLAFGYKIFNWTATEAFHPADIINARNLDSDIESLTKIGELHVEFGFNILDGFLSLYYFPRAQDPSYPGKNSRLGAGVELEEPIWVKKDTSRSKNNWIFQGGFRYSKTLDNADLSFHVIHHMDRDMPLIHLDITKEPLFGIPTDVKYVPHYFRVIQYGGTYQHAIAGWMLKFETAYRDFIDDNVNLLTVRGFRTPKDHVSTAAGLEYSASHNNGTDSNFFIEFGGIFGAPKQKRSELSIFQRDIMLGWRFTLNDPMGKEFFLGIIRDIERKDETIYNFSYSQRLTDYWKIKTGARVQNAPKKDTYETGLEGYHKDNYVYLNISRFF